jgi:hypothetical protein
MWIIYITLFMLLEGTQLRLPLISRQMFYYLTRLITNTIARTGSITTSVDWQRFPQFIYLYQVRAIGMW